MGTDICRNATPHYILVLCSQGGFGAELFQDKTEPPHVFCVWLRGVNPLLVADFA